MPITSDGEVVARLVLDSSGVATGVRTADGSMRQLETTGGRVRGVFSSLQARMIAAGAVVGALAGTFRVLSRAVTEAGEASRGMDRLRVALRNAGDGSEEAVQGIARVASQLQATTNYTDDAAIAAGSLLASFRAVGGAEGVGMLLPRLADVSAGMARAGEEGMSLETVARAVGRAVEGQTAGLSRFGVVLTEAEKAAIEAAQGMERVELIAAALDARFKGMAQTAADPFTILNNAVGELYEALGEALYPAAGRVAAVMAELARSEGTVNFFRALGQAIAVVVTNTIEAIRQVYRIADALLAVIPAGTEARRQLEGLATAAQVMAVAIQVVLFPLRVFAATVALATSNVIALARALTGDIQGAARQFAQGFRSAGQIVADGARGMAEAINGAGNAAEALGGKLRDKPNFPDFTADVTAAADATDRFKGIVEQLTEELENLRRVRADLLAQDPAVIAGMTAEVAGIQEVIDARMAMIEDLANLARVGISATQRDTPAEAAGPIAFAGIVPTQEEIDAAVARIREGTDRIAEVIAAGGDKMRVAAEHVGIDLTEILVGGIENAIFEFSDAIAAAIVDSTSGIDALASALMASLGSMAVQMGRMMIQFGLAGLALKKIAMGNPVAAIVAGTALVALGLIAQRRAHAIVNGQGDNNNANTSSQTTGGSAATATAVGYGGGFGGGSGGGLTGVPAPIVNLPPPSFHVVATGEQIAVVANYGNAQINRTRGRDRA